MDKRSTVVNVVLVIVLAALMFLGVYSIVARRATLPVGGTKVFIDPVPTSTVPPQDKVCIQVLTQARNMKTAELKTFPTPCDVPDGWEVVGPIGNLH